MIPPADDRKARDLIDTKNQADSMVYQTEKQLKEFADKVGRRRPRRGGVGGVGGLPRGKDAQRRRTAQAGTPGGRPRHVAQLSAPRQLASMPHGCAPPCCCSLPRSHPGA